MINGKLVIIRAPEKCDMVEYTAMARASEKFHRGLIKMSRTAEEFDSFLERCKNPANANFLICRASDGAIAGMINLSQIFYGPFENAYLGYGLGAAFTGQGLMTEAVARS